MIYPSKKDTWIVLLVLPLAILLIVGGAFLLALVVNQAAPPFALVPGLSLTAVGGLLLWLMNSTATEIAAPNLIVHFGPVHWRIPLTAIVDVQPKQGLSPDASWGFAWSMDRVIIRFRRRNGRVAALGVAVSPMDKEGFLQELALAIEGERGPRSAPRRG